MNFLQNTELQMRLFFLIRPCFDVSFQIFDRNVAADGDRGHRTGVKEGKTGERYGKHDYSRFERLSIFFFLGGRAVCCSNLFYEGRYSLSYVLYSRLT